MQPIDAQTNGPQLYYCLRRHTLVVKPNEVETFRDKIGYWLWESANGALVPTLAIPRGQIAMVIGKESPDAKNFKLVAQRGSDVNGICLDPFLEYVFQTREYRIRLTINPDGT